jgi:probable F420-dependent oxidoreductase
MESTLSSDLYPCRGRQRGIVRVGVAVPYYEQYASFEAAMSFALRAEELGFDILWFADHVALPGHDVPRMGGRWFEMITLMSHVSARAQRIGLGTDVLVAPYRHPILAARMLSTLDIVSGGRLIVGVGGGYVEEEFRALDLPFAERGSYTDECILVWKAMWTEQLASFQGRHFSFEDVTTEPHPVQSPHPPIWIGNASPPVLRRTARLGDGWHPCGLGFDALERCIETLERESERAGRSSPLTLSYSGLFGWITRDALPEGERLPLVGSVDQIHSDLHRFRGLGFDSVLFRFGTHDGTVDGVMEQLDLCAREILPAARS